MTPDSRPRPASATISTMLLCAATLALLLSAPLLAQEAPAADGDGAKPADAKPADAKPADAKPSDAEPDDTKPADTKPADAQASGGEPLIINAVGDVALTTKAFPSIINPMGPKLFDKTRDVLKSGDLVFLNLETPLTEGEATLSKKYAYTMPPKRLDWLLSAGFNLFSLANNHSADAGERGIKDTLDLMEETRKGREHFYWSGTHLDRKDAYKPTMIDIKGTRIAFLAVGNNGDPKVNRLHRKRVFEAVTKMKAEADIALISVHWGKEYQHVPNPGTVQLYHAIANAGADIILGHHPHVLRGIEKFKDTLIIHSLGNFCFSSKTIRHRETGARLYSMIASIEIDKKRVQRVVIHPLYVNNLEPWRIGDRRLPPANFVPTPVDGPFADKVLEELQDWSDAIPGNEVRIKRDGDLGVIDF